MRCGKLSSDELKKCVLANTPSRNSLVGADLGEDCAVVEHDGLLVITTDPITASCNNIGKRAIDVCLNDVASAGGTPLYCTLTILLPVSDSSQSVADIVEDAGKECGKYGVEIVGGHTEFTSAVLRPVVSVTMLASAKRVLSKKGIKAGDSIIATKSIGLEGVNILVEQRLEEAKQYLTEDEIEEALAFSEQLLVVAEGRAVEGLTVSAMHDVTEGGIVGATTELAELNDLGVVLHGERIPILPTTQKVCKVFEVDPLRLMSSGCMLIITDKPQEILKALEQKDIPATVIGEFTDGRDRILISKEGTTTLAVCQDELYRALK